MEIIMKTVLEVTGRMNRGGAETMLLDIIRQTYRDFNYVFLINARTENEREGEYDAELIELGCKFYYIGTVWNMGIPAYTKAFIEICNKIKDEISVVDVVHCHMNSKCGTVLRAAERAGVKKRIAHSHAEIRFNGSLPIVVANYLELYFQKYLINKYATDYWGCSKKALPSLYSKKHINSPNCVVIKNAIDINRFINAKEQDIKEYRKIIGIPEGKKVIGVVGRIARVKNLGFLIDVLYEICKHLPNVCMVVVGSEQDASYSREIHDAVETYGLENNVIFTGVQSRLELVYPNFDMLLGASLREGLGLVAVEAQACDIPCVLSAGFPEEVDIGLNLVHFIERYDKNLWTQCVIDILNGKIRVKKSHKETIAEYLVKAGYDASEEAKKVKKLYEMT